MERYNQICLCDRVRGGFRKGGIEYDLRNHLANVMPIGMDDAPNQARIPATMMTFQIAQYLKHLKPNPAIKKHHFDRIVRSGKCIFALMDRLMTKLSLFNRILAAAVSWLWQFPRLRGRAFIIDRLLPYVRAIPSFYGPILRVRPGDFTNRSAIFGSYGNEVASWVRTLEADDVFLDIGANTGLFSLIADKYVAHGRIFAFEPNPSLFADFRFNIDVNRATHIVPLNIALSDKTGTSTLSYNPQHTGAASLGTDGSAASAGASLQQDIVIAIAPAALEALIDATAGRRICVKVDVEGHELNVLRGLADAGLLDRCGWVIAEIDHNHLNRFGSTAKDIYDLMTANGFQAKKGPVPSEHYDEIFVQRASGQRLERA